MCLYLLFSDVVVALRIVFAPSADLDILQVGSSSMSFTYVITRTQRSTDSCSTTLGSSRQLRFRLWTYCFLSAIQSLRHQNTSPHMPYRVASNLFRSNLCRELFKQFLEIEINDVYRFCLVVCIVYKIKVHQVCEA